MTVAKHRSCFLILITMSLLVSCSAPQQEQEVELYVLAATSLTDALEEIQDIYEKEHPHVKLVPNFASSGKLQKQIEEGAPADLFISAGGKEMKALLDKDLIESNYHTPLLRNRLVLIVPEKNRNKIKDFPDLIRADRIAVGQPDTVPAGDYTKQALKQMKLWDKLQSRMVFAGDVRQVLTYVETGNTDTGLVYQTDAQTSDKVSVVATASPDSHQPIVYPVGVVKSSQRSDEARQLYDWLRGEKAKAIFGKYGFQDVEKP